MRLITSPTAVSRITGLSPRDDLIFPGICLDSMELFLPVLIDTGDETVMVARSVEKMSINERSHVDLPITWYRAYFMMDQAKMDTNVHASFAEAVASLISPCEALVVSSDLPLSLRAELAEVVRLEPAPAPETYFFHYRVDRSRVAERFLYRDWARLVQVALGLLDEERQEWIKPYLVGGAIDRYEDLAQRLSGEGLEGLVLSNPLDLQELCGLGLFQVPRGALAVFDGEEVDLLSPRPLDLPWLRMVGEGRDLLRHLKECKPQGRLGVDPALPLDAAEAVQEGAAPPLATKLLRQWKEARVSEDLPCYVIAAQATSRSQEAAFAFARASLEAGRPFCERDLYSEALDFQDDFMRAKLAPLGLRVPPYFVNLHSAYRTLYPSVPSKIQVDPKTRCIRFDTGVLVLDHQGFVRACSDVGRSLVLPGPGAEVYELLRSTIVEEVIPSLGPGRIGRDIHAQVIESIASRESFIKAQGLMNDEDGVVEKYRRDVGHLLGKQEVTSFHIDPSEGEALVEGMVGDIEVPWLFGEYALGYEDMFLVTATGGVDLSAVPEGAQ